MLHIRTRRNIFGQGRILASRGALFFLLATGSFSIRGQINTDIYLADLEIGQEGIRVSVPVNISNNPGYDNQPSLLNEIELLYSRTRNGQTDIALYSVPDGTTSWLSDTPGGSEYSPVRRPEHPFITVIRLDTTGLQRLYNYPLTDGKPERILEDLKVGYQLWIDKDILVCTVLVDDRMDLVLINFRNGTRHTYQKNVGRSLLKIPGSERFSYVSLQGDSPVVKSMDPNSGATDLVATLPEGVQDLCWLPGGTLICGYGNALLGLHPGRDSQWREVHVFSPALGIISRITVSRGGTKLALVVENRP